ncbi:PaaI family thioesterase [Paenibacillus crassostreae]|uniref:Thioesterase n=1 Tax=Paenibacillus crassostreae TaxID=1763538 RepID=A0A167CJ94_9BACL|nr:PaaI family thioesterase [Paenibacillus crassostreae]AOZ91817.1 thioesterase [Paenibacillus crassostreae]OAB73260.1 thioesterase [Paenibacillus crassostreae]
MKDNSDNIHPNFGEWEQLAKSTFWGFVGCVFEELKEQKVVVSIDILPHHLNQIGILHGGVHATLIDSAMGLIGMIARPENNIVTTNLTLNYVAPVEKGKVFVTAEIIHSSRKLINTQAYVRTENGELCAFGTGTFRVISKP